jgi:hypothetical protein
MQKLPFFLLLLLLSLTACKVSDYASDSKPIKHNLWDSLLQKHVTPGGLVDYKGFIEDSTRLNRYLDLLSRNHPNEKNWSRDERLAYWINAYNAFTVKLIVDHYPVGSIKDIKNGVPFVNTVWDIKFIKIEDRTYDLNNIEHGIIRPKFEEPRIHFAVNCAAQSCPKLQNFAYTADRLDEQLTQSAKEFLANDRKNKVSQNKVELSKIFTWYGGDFKTDGRSIIEYINQYAPIQVDENATVSYLDYNWGLNDVE